MRKTITALLLSIAISFTFASCSKKNDSSKGPTSDQQMSGTCEDAFKELYSAIYTKNGGEVFYSYTFPSFAIEAMKQNGEYAKLISTYNSTQQEFVELMKYKPEINEFSEKTPFTEEQKKASQRYFEALVKDIVPDKKAEDFKVLEGYELKCSITDFNGRPDTDTECIVKLEGDGWKVITQSAAGLEANFPG